MSWGVLAYIVADDRANSGDSLDEVAGLDLERLRVAAKRAGIPMAAQIDYQGKPGIWRQVFGTHDESAKIREADSSRSEVLADFLTWGLKRCRADRYVVMLWGHGSGPGGFFSDASRNTPAKDGGHPLNPRQLATALRKLAVERNKKTDILLLKSCFAATVELAVQLEETTDLIIASQSLIPGQTFWPYPRLFQYLKSAGKIKPEDVGVELVDILGNFYGNDVNRPGKTEVPYSLLDTATGTKVADGLTDIVAAWRAAGRPDMRGIAAQCCPDDPGLIDVARFCQTLINVGDDKMTRAATRLRASVAQMVIRHQPQVSAYRGVSVFYHPGYGMYSPARDTAPYGIYKRSRLAQYNQRNSRQGGVAITNPSWVEVAFQNTTIAKLAQAQSGQEAKQ